MPPPPGAAPAGAERVLAVRKVGGGHQYEVKWHGHAEATWEPAWRVRKEIPALLQAFEQQQQQQQQGEGRAEGAATDGAQHAQPAAQLASNAPDIAAMSAQMAEMARAMQAQQAELAALKTQQSPQGSPRSLDAAQAASQLPAAAQQSRFARKEPRAQDLREYDGASGAKLDDWLDELSASQDG